MVFAQKNAPAILKEHCLTSTMLIARNLTSSLIGPGLEVREPMHPRAM